MAEGALWLTGATGFAGRELLRQLRAAGCPWASLGRRPPGTGGPWLRLGLEEAAASSAAGLAGRLEGAGLPPPAAFLHLAGWSRPGDCQRRELRARLVNTVAAARLLEAMQLAFPGTPSLLVSSAAVYAPSRRSLREEDPCRPRSVYGATKLQAEGAALGLRDRGLPVAAVRPFNHTGPDQGPGFVLPDLALRLARLEQAGGGVLETGSLEAVRDFLPVEAVVRAYRALLERVPDFEVVNVCSGRGLAIRELLDGLLRRVSVRVEVHSPRERRRGAWDHDCLIGDPARLEALLGWRPRLELDALLDAVWEAARQRVRQEEAAPQPRTRP